MNWLVVSIIASVVLTVVLNVVVRAFPSAGRRTADWIDERSRRTPDDDRHARVIVPWRAMIIGSIALTIVLNLFLWLA